jgi:NADH pyrophosphatase NudC (nudix superfamily)
MNYSFCPKCGSSLIIVELGGKPRQKCSSESCDHVFWDNPTPVVASIVEHEGNVILVQNKGWPEKWFGIVAGFLEKGETPEQGALREIKEEIGLDGEIVSFIGHYYFEQMNQLIVAFHVKAEGEIILGDELARYKALPPEKVRPWNLGTGPALKDWLNARKKG